MIQRLVLRDFEGASTCVIPPLSYGVNFSGIARVVAYAASSEACQASRMCLKSIGGHGERRGSESQRQAEG